MTTLHITNSYHPTSGGIRTFYAALLTRANERQRRMRLVVPGETDAVEEVGRHGRIYFVRARPAPAFDRRYRMMMPPTYLPPWHGRVAAILEAEQPELVEICDKYSLCYLAALLRKGLLPRIARPALVGVSCERMDDNLRAFLGGGAIADGFARHYIRRIYGPPFDCHVANSDYTADELRTSLWDRAPNFIRVCPMGVAADRFGAHHRDRLLRRTLLERAGGDERSVLLLYVGRLSPEKNVGLLAAMMERLLRASHQAIGAPDYRLVLVGDGPAGAQLRAAAPAGVRERLLFVGPVTSAELLCRYHASADLFVHPNPREPFGIAPLEAMASGVPLVAPNAGGVLTYASAANAWLAPAEPEAFALAVRSAAELPDPIRVQKARQTALAFEWPSVADRWFALYDSLVPRFARPRQRAS